MQANEVAVGVKPGCTAELGNRPIEVVRLSSSRLQISLTGVPGNSWRWPRPGARSPACRRAGRNRRRDRAGSTSHLSSGRPETSDSAANAASAFCVGTHTSALSAETMAVQFIGSMVAWARNGVE